MTFILSKADNINLRKYSLSLAKLKPCFKKALDILLSFDEIKKSKVFSNKVNKLNFDVSLCSSDTIQKLNREYRKKDLPTDVITFALFSDVENPVIYRKTAELGEIVICVDIAFEQKTSSLTEELTTLFTHGVLHLLGFDHLTQKDYDFVVGIQNKVIKKLAGDYFE